MSYCRFIEADVYAYQSAQGWDIFVTQRSDALHAGAYFCEPTLQAFETRMKELRNLGYYIPDYVFAQIAEEIEEEAKP